MGLVQNVIRNIKNYFTSKVDKKCSLGCVFTVVRNEFRVSKHDKRFTLIYSCRLRDADDRHII